MRGTKGILGTGSIRNGRSLEPLFGPLPEETMLLARVIALAPQKLQRHYSGTHLTYASFGSERVTAKIRDLRRRGIVISGKLTKYGASLL